MNDDYQRMAANAISHEAFCAGQAWQQAAAAYERPSVLWKPRLFRDGDQWCALLGENIQDGAVGFGSSPDAAMWAFDAAWREDLSDHLEAQPTQCFADAYQGAMEEVAIWKKRALEAEDLNRKFVAEINGPTYMGGPAQPAPSVPDGWKLVPIEPTDEMLRAIRAQRSGARKGRGDRADWKAWLAAAPEATSLASSRSPSVPDGWLRAIDEALVVANIGVANESDTYEQAKAKLDSLIGFHVDVATDPAVNGGWKLVPRPPTPTMVKAGLESSHVLNVHRVLACYDAMIDAAPEAKP